MGPARIVWIAIFIFFKETYAISQTNEYDGPQAKPPAFVTPGQTYRIASGATVILPCRITQPGSYVLAWKRGIAVLTAGPVKVSPDPRLRVLPSPTIESPAPIIGGVPELSGGGYSLELRDVKPQDAGDYICQLGTIEPKEIVHTLEVLVPARIHFVSHVGTVEVSQGQMVKMECRASGNPVPKVSWTRKNNNMPSGDKSVEGLTMVIQHADRHSAGQYQCSADNGVGEPDTKHITINVLYPPEVEVERATVHTGIGLEAQLVCIVYAEPSAQVLWYKETTQLGTTEQHTTQSRGNRHTLTIRNVSQVDMGNYSCVASNIHGKSRGHIFLSGTATTAVIDSPTVGTERDKYTLSWSVNSHSSIIEYRLFYRQQPRHHQGHHQHRQEDSNDLRNYKFNGTRIVGLKPEWISMNIPGPGIVNPNFPQGVPPPYPGVTKQKMSYTIQNLMPATTYEVRVQAKNDQGWNKLSPVFHFSTRVNDMENLIEPSAQPAVYGSNLNPLASSKVSQIRPKAVFGMFCVILGTVFVN
ncbi:opioid-binding protein/cell adhesion molecule-like [Anthonomus grandis grandis]|uniref:opioid-binding protein/cell adhesion molecule-like n=1 Tax=Anthonomus grandis grandis TaxID=2921223 RepID=UPI002166AF00|nr:opioid-binding protein/cell adhesion molecule-like [Anthonomus grandis grandis]